MRTRILPMLLTLAFSPAVWADDICYNTLSQDLNCNAIDEVDERAVDLTDEECLSHTGDDGAPYPNADYY